jgi:hypothetical protein
MGMFATAPIRRGEVVVVWGGTKILTEEDIHCGRGAGYDWATIGEGLYLAAPKDGDDLTNCMNHSCDPNVWMADEVTLVARRDIAVDEELTLDYCLIEGDEDWTGRWACCCGSALCRGCYTGRDWRCSELQERYHSHFSPFINVRISRLQRVACGHSDSPDD